MIANCKVTTLAAVTAAIAAPITLAADATLTFVADHVQIQELIVKAAKARDTTDPELRKQIFAEDSETRVQDNERTVAASGPRGPGAAALPPLQARQPGGLTAEQQRFNPSYKPGTTTYGVMRHVVTNIDITVTGNAATGDYYVFTYGNNPDAKRPELVSVARNEDTFVKRSGRWFIQSTKLNYDWGNDEMARLMKLGPYSPGLEPPASPSAPPAPPAQAR